MNSEQNSQSFDVFPHRNNLTGIETEEDKIIPLEKSILQKVLPIMQ